MRILGYIRVSTDEQKKHGHSLPQQREQFIQYCNAFGHTLVDIIADEGVSGSKSLESRAGGRELLNRLDAGEAYVVLIRDLDRMFRLTLDGLMTFAWFDRRGITVHSINDSIDTASPEGKLALTIRLATCEYERNKTAQRTRNTMRSLKAEGRVYGPVPFGLAEVDGYLYKDPATWHTRELIMELREAGISLRGICSELIKDKIEAPKGGRLWNVSTVTGLINSFHDFDHIPFLADVCVSGETVIDKVVRDLKNAG